MISLERQFQSVVLSFSFGMFFMFVYSIFDYLFSNRRWYIRLPFESLLFVLLTKIYYKYSCFLYFNTIKTFGQTNMHKLFAKALNFG